MERVLIICALWGSVILLCIAFRYLPRKRSPVQEMSHNLESNPEFYSIIDPYVDPDWEDDAEDIEPEGDTERLTVPMEVIDALQYYAAHPADHEIAQDALEHIFGLALITHHDSNVHKVEVFIKQTGPVDRQLAESAREYHQAKFYNQQVKHAKVIHGKAAQRNKYRFTRRAILKREK